MSKWESVVVEDIKSDTPNALVGGPFGSNLVSRDYVDKGIPVIRGSNMGQGRWVVGPFAYVSEEKASELSGNTARPGDLVFTQRGTLGQVCLVPQEPLDAYIISQSQMKLTPDRSKADGLFLYYVFSSPSQQHYIQQNAIQTGVPHTNLGILREAPLELPPLPAQQRIAHILGTLDDKIELNRRMNRTLEAIARAIFKSWFIDFDPVHAKSEGREPIGMDAETAALFPDSFEDSPLGKIPKGWEVGTIRDLGEIVCGKTPPTAQPENYGDGVPFVTIPDMRDSVFVVSTSRQLTHVGAATQAKKLLPVMSVCVSCIATPGLVSLTCVPSHTNQQINSIVCSSRVNPYWCYLQLKAMHNEIITGGAGGSTTLNLNKGRFSALKLFLPPVLVQTAFHGIVKPIFTEVLVNAQQAKTFSQVRDALVPRLLSGEMTVADSESEGITNA